MWQGKKKDPSSGVGLTCSGEVEAGLQDREELTDRGVAGVFVLVGCDVVVVLRGRVHGGEQHQSRADRVETFARLDLVDQSLELLIGGALVGHQQTVDGAGLFLDLADEPIDPELDGSLLRVALHLTAVTQTLVDTEATLAPVDQEPGVPDLLGESVQGVLELEFLPRRSREVLGAPELPAESTQLDQTDRKPETSVEEADEGGHDQDHADHRRSHGRVLALDRGDQLGTGEQQCGTSQPHDDGGQPAQALLGCTATSLAQVGERLAARGTVVRIESGLESVRCFRERRTRVHGNLPFVEATGVLL